jgi:hypothetical protein
MITIIRSLKPAAYRHSIPLRGFAANLGESAGLFPVFVGRLSAANFGRLFSRIGSLRLKGSDSQQDETAKDHGDDDKTQANWNNAAFVLMAVVGGFNAMLDNLPYVLGGESPATRINRCWSQVLPGGACP